MSALVTERSTTCPDQVDVARMTLGCYESNPAILDMLTWATRLAGHKFLRLTGLPARWPQASLYLIEPGPLPEAELLLITLAGMRDTPIVIITSHKMVPEMAEALELPVLTKPFHLAELFDLSRRLLVERLLPADALFLDEMMLSPPDSIISSLST